MENRRENAFMPPISDMLGENSPYIVNVKRFCEYLYLCEDIDIILKGDIYYILAKTHICDGINKGSIVKISSCDGKEFDMLYINECEHNKEIINIIKETKKWPSNEYFQKIKCLQQGISMIYYFVIETKGYYTKD